MITEGAEEEWLSPLLATWRGHRAWVLDRQIAITRIAAPTGNESARAQALQLAWERGGHTVTRDAVGNVITRITPAPSGPPDATDVLAPVVCLAHLDTVFSADTPLAVRRDGPRLYCPGIGDNGRGLAAMLALAHVLHEPAVRTRLRRPVELVLTVGEEGAGNLRGARQWCDDAAASGVLPLAAVAVDGPGDTSIVHHAVGSTRLRITLSGAGGHSWADHATPNPVHAAGACIARIAQLAASVRPSAVVTVTRMHGGELLTGVPMHAWIDVDIRSLHPERLQSVRTAIEGLAADEARHESQRDPALPLHCTITSLGERPAGQLEAQHPLVLAATAATHAVGRVARSASASTDANLPLSRGIPAIAIGAGGTGRAAHTADEWYDDTDGDVGLERVLRLIITLGTTSDWTRPPTTRRR